MDYKYIEQLLERYWNCETSLEEEQILRSFFHQKEIPAHLLRYKAMFAYQEIEKERGLGSDFDAKVLARVEKTGCESATPHFANALYAVVQGCCHDSCLVCDGNGGATFHAG